MSTDDTDTGRQIRRHVQTLLQQRKARSLLLIHGASTPCDENWPAPADTMDIVRVDTDNVDAALNNDARYDAVIVSGVLEHLDLQEGERLLARLRNRHTPWVCVSLARPTRYDDDQDTGWDHTAFIALGFVRAGVLGDGPQRIEIYVHDIDTYRPTPSWFGPANWANPGLWNRFRW